jgi:hypothetical protein
VSVSFDSSEVTALAADLSKAADVAPEKVRKAVEVTARKVKDSTREKWSGSSQVPGAAGSVSYEFTGFSGLFGSALSCEVGYETGGQGSVAGMLEVGTPTTGPRGYLTGALQENEGDFVAGILKATGDIL